MEVDLSKCPNCGSERISARIMQGIPYGVKPHTTHTYGCETEYWECNDGTTELNYQSEDCLHNQIANLTVERDELARRLAVEERAHELTIAYIASKLPPNTIWDWRTFMDDKRQKAEAERGEADG